MTHPWFCGCSTHILPQQRNCSSAGTKVPCAVVGWAGGECTCMILSSSVVFNCAPLLLLTPAHPPTLSCLGPDHVRLGIAQFGTLQLQCTRAEVVCRSVQKKDPTKIVLVTCMHDTPVILWTQHAHPTTTTEWWQSHIHTGTATNKPLKNACNLTNFLRIGPLNW